MGFGRMSFKGWTKEKAIAGAAAGLAGGVAYAATMAADIRLFHYNSDDYLLLGGALGLRSRSASLVGRGIHFLNSAILGVAFERLAYRQLPYAPAVNGAIFATVENAALYPGLFVLEGLHPAINKGDLTSYKNWTAFAQSAVRHVAYGAVAGWTLRAILDRSAAST